MFDEIHDLRGSSWISINWRNLGPSAIIQERGLIYVHEDVNRCYVISSAEFVGASWFEGSYV